MFFSISGCERVMFVDVCGIRLERDHDASSRFVSEVSRMKVASLASEVSLLKAILLVSAEPTHTAACSTSKAIVTVHDSRIVCNTCSRVSVESQSSANQRCV